MEISELNFYEIDRKIAEKHYASTCVRIFLCKSGRKDIIKALKIQKNFIYFVGTILPYLERRKENDRDEDYYGKEVIDKRTKDSTAMKWGKGKHCNLRIYCRELFHEGVLYVLMCKVIKKKTQENNKVIKSLINATRDYEFNIDIINKIDLGE